MKDRRGFALIATLLVMLLVSVVIATAVTGAVGAIRQSNLNYRNSKVFYAAEAGAEAIMAQLDDALEDGVIDDGELSGVTPPDITGFTFSDFRVEKVGGIVVEQITDGPFAGLYSLTQRVDIHSEVQDAMYNTSSVIISAKAQAIPIFQFGIFFEKDLEATNGPNMEFAGWIHSNGNIYLSSNNAWYRDIITTPNNVYWDRKDFHSVKNGVFVDDAFGNEVQLDFDSRSHPLPDDFRAESDAKFDGRLKTDAYGVDSLQVPLPDGMSPIAVMQPRLGGDDPLVKQAKFAWKADFYVEIDLDAISAGGGNLCNGPAMVTRDGGEPVPGVVDCQDIITWTWEAFYERRELKHADVLDIDLDKLFDWTDGDPSRETQIMYVTFTGNGLANDPSNDGVYPIVRLQKGDQLRNAFTFATDQPIYIQGDYNKSNWRPAAVVGDALTILSTAWQDSDNQLSDPPRPDAGATEVYTAVLAGHTATPCDHEDVGCPGGYTDFYGGGIENYPRFLERWSGITLTYSGSLVSLSASVMAVGTWNGTYYSPPVRNWSFDTRFSDPANLPPGTPVVGNVIQTAFRPGY